MESLEQLLRFSALGNQERRQRLAEIVGSLLEREDVIGSVGRSVAEVERIGYDIEEKEVKGVKRLVVKGLVDDVGAMVRPLKSEGDDGAVFIERAIMAVVD